VKLEVDENLPREAAELLRSAVTTRSLLPIKDSAESRMII